MKLIEFNAFQDGDWVARRGKQIHLFTGNPDEDRKLSFYEGEPEDATFNRDYSDLHNIRSMIKKVSEWSAKTGKVIEVGGFDFKGDDAFEDMDDEIEKQKKVIR